MQQFSTILNNIGGIYYSLSKYEEAIQYYEEALKLSIETGNSSNIALINDNLGNIYISREQANLARNYFLKALDLRRQLGEQSGIATTLNNLAITYINEENYSDAISLLTESVTILEKLRLSANEDARRDYMNNQIFAYQNLIISLVKTGNNEKAFYYNELSRAKQLAEKIAKNENIPIPSLSETQQTIDENTAIIIFSTVDNIDITTFLITNKSTNINSRSKEHILRKLLDDNDVKEIVISKLTLAEIIRLQDFVKNNNSKAVDQRLTNKIFANVIKAYSQLLNSPKYKDVVKTKKLSKTLYTFLFAPYETELQSKTNLLIMQDGILGYLPFETLISEDNKYLIEKYDISYINSFSVRKLISERTYSPQRKSILAMGVSKYNNASQTPQQSFALNLTDLKDDIYKAINRNEDLTHYYQRIGYTKFNNLPESINEINTICSLFEGAESMLDTNVFEHNIKALSGSGKLKDYKYIHFSTHGVSVPEIPELSALILYKNDATNTDDGYLRMGEIAQLDLNADYVNLSACETGLGKVYSGEGVVGLAQAFISAGANSISVSLWQVDESSTAQFMKTVYKKAMENNYNFNKAINDVKREFISGEYGVAWMLPYFWAPFIYYGN